MGVVLYNGKRCENVRDIGLTRENILLLYETGETGYIPTGANHPKDILQIRGDVTVNTVTVYNNCTLVGDIWVLKARGGCSVTGKVGQLLGGTKAHESRKSLLKKVRKIQDGYRKAIPGLNRRKIIKVYGDFNTLNEKVFDIRSEVFLKGKFGKVEICNCEVEGSVSRVQVKSVCITDCKG